MGKDSTRSVHRLSQIAVTGLAIVVLVVSMTNCVAARASDNLVGSEVSAAASAPKPNEGLDDVLIELVRGAGEDSSDLVESVVAHSSDLAKNPGEDSSDPGFVRVSLNDLKQAENLTIIQDTRGPSVAVLEICNSVKGYGEFEPNPSHEFSRSLFGRAWLYTEIDRISADVGSDDTYFVSLSADVVVLDQQERIIWQKAKAFSFEERLESPVYGVYAYVYVPTIFLSKGEYNLEITINDNVAQTKSRVNTLIRIK